MRTFLLAAVAAVLVMAASAQYVLDYVPPYPQRNCSNPPIAMLQREAINQTTGLPPQEREVAARTYLNGAVKTRRWICESTYYAAFMEWEERVQRYSNADQERAPSTRQHRSQPLYVRAMSTIRAVLINQPGGSHGTTWQTHGQKVWPQYVSEAEEGAALNAIARAMRLECNGCVRGQIGDREPRA